MGVFNNPKRRMGMGIILVATAAFIVGSLYSSQLRWWFWSGWAIALVVGNILNRIGWKEETNEQRSR